MKHAWIINHYTPFAEKDGWVGLHLEMADDMAGGEWQVTVLAASTSHPDGRQHLRQGERRRLVRWRNTESLWIRSAEYSGNGLSRIRNMATFGATLMLPATTRVLPNPDVVIGRVVNPVAAWASARIAKKFAVPFVLEISDIWPDTLVQLGKLSAHSLPARGLGALEKWLISRADAVMSPMPAIDDYLATKGFGDVPFYWVPNGVNGNQRLPLNDETVRVDVRHERPFRFMYLGSLGHANAVDTILEAFQQFTSSHPERRVALEIVGGGPLKSDLKETAKQLGIDHLVEWTDRIPREDVLDRLSGADALVANMRDLELYRYGIALNKLFDYLLSARPIVFASNAVNNIVDDAKAGITVPADSSLELALAMADMMDADAEQRNAWGRAGRQHVLENYTYSDSATRLKKMLYRVSGDS
ncbi:glycosyltransferase family 4 protein [Citricoccus alkalitolerans]|uniref:Glycosyltransferase family 4 protein n=1 Tax=Citricoccus alkalitolerans TaxID=246603 RepID=A0ABV8XUW0_9MICC